MKEVRYRTMHDIVILAGTIVGHAPLQTFRGTVEDRAKGVSGHVDVTIPHGPDLASNWTIYLPDALAEGIVEAVPPHTITKE